MKTTRFHEYELSQLMLGTAQFGFEYGINNQSGKPSFEEACRILQAAHEGGVNCLDTAPTYGESEEVLGRALQELKLRDKMIVVSKALRTVRESDSPEEIAKVVEAGIIESLQRLRLEVLPICLVHDETNFPYIEALWRAQEKGLVRHVGGSAARPDAARRIVESGRAQAMQIPTSILDRRFAQNGVLREAKAREVAIFVRSAYLQGLILMRPEEVPPDLQAALPALRALRELAHEAGLSIEELAMRYVMGLEGVTCVVVGVESAAQMERNVEIFRRGSLEGSVQQRASSLVLDLPDLIFEPFRWQKRIPDIPARA